MKLLKKQVDKVSEIEDGYVIKNGDRYIFLSEEAKLVWDLCENLDSVKKLRRELSRFYSDVNESKIVNLLKTLESYGLIEILGKEKKSTKLVQNCLNFRPIKKIKLFSREKVLKLLRVSEPLLGFLTEDKWIIASYIIPWLAFLFYTTFAKINPFLEILYMNYATVIFLVPVLILHELAHAVVSEKLGAEVKEFGIGVYQIIFFFYTDTSQTLLLKRKDRIKVSLAGPAINFIFGLIFMTISGISGNKVFLILSFLLFILGLVALAPTFESDGYYALMDYGRLNNPRREIFSFIGSLFKKEKEPLKKRQKVALSVYMLSVLYSVGLLVYFCLFFLPVCIERQIYYMQKFLSLKPFELASFFFGMLYLTLTFSIAISLSIRLCTRVFSMVKPKIIKLTRNIQVFIRHFMKLMRQRGVTYALTALLEYAGFIMFITPGEYLRFLTNDLSQWRKRLYILRRFWTIHRSVTCIHRETELLRIADHLLSIPNSLEGDIIECGVYRGGSTCKLSIIAKLTGRKLVACDSFSGLPMPGKDEKMYFKQGEYSSSINEVHNNLVRFGEPDSVEIIPGWFHETLPKLRNRKFVAIIEDADLYESVLCCIENLWPALQPGCKMFTHEVSRPAAKAYLDRKFWLRKFGHPPPPLYRVASGLISPNLGYIQKPIGLRRSSD